MIVWTPIFPRILWQDPMTIHPTNSWTVRFLKLPIKNTVQMSETMPCVKNPSVKHWKYCIPKQSIPPPTHTWHKNTKNTHILLSHIVFTNWGILHDLPCIGIYHDLRGFPVNKKPPQGFLANVAQGRAPMARFMPGVLGSLGSGVWGRFSNGWVVP